MHMSRVHLLVWQLTVDQIKHFVQIVTLTK